MRLRILLTGVVQGVGFRPFVKRLADRLGCTGVTFNTSAGLVIEIDQTAEAAAFLEALRAQAPANAQIESCTVHEIERDVPYVAFTILASPERDHSFTLIPPDLATCAECRAEIADPAARRFQYAFTNCTNCGPRYSITRSTPYDRVNTTMAPFSMCAACAAEYNNASDRRFHAEPIACPDCGPRLSGDSSLPVQALVDGRIVALKGIGGFQLACDAFSASAIELLRTRKQRSRKPFAVMMKDLATVTKCCRVSVAEQQLLDSSIAPIVLLEPRNRQAFPEQLSPGLREIGVMLPYTPLHYLLFGKELECLVMTSGNLSEEPIVIHNTEAVEKLGPLAELVLTHDRDIFMRVDDSLTRVFENRARVLRRARGYAPGAIALNCEAPELLAVGVERKSTFCITKGKFAILSQHLGELENFETLHFFEETWRNLQSVYQAQPRLIVHDLHPDYLSTRWALERAEPKLAVQHHHAHIASCMAENGIDEPVIGVAFDGTGLGVDGEVWGGEFLLCDYQGFRRAAHLRYVALPGGDRAARQGWRMAAAHLYDAFGAEFRALDLPYRNAGKLADQKLVEHMLARPSIRTSSCGRLFDAVASLCGVCHESAYEGEAAMLLEAAATPGDSQPYPFQLDRDSAPWTLDTRPMIRAIAEEVRAGVSASKIARCFHDSLAHMIEAVCCELREMTKRNTVCFSGGAFQNFTLVSKAAELLRKREFNVILHAQIPPNDGGISLGQAAIGVAYLLRN